MRDCGGARVAGGAGAHVLQVQGGLMMRRRFMDSHNLTPPPRCSIKEGNQTRLEQRKKEKADKEKMAQEMQSAQAAKKQEEDAARARMDSAR